MPGEGNGLPEPISQHQTQRVPFCDQANFLLSQRNANCSILAAWFRARPHAMWFCWLAQLMSSISFFLFLSHSVDLANYIWWHWRRKTYMNRTGLAGSLRPDN
jgi:hypothetical protein